MMQKNSCMFEFPALLLPTNLGLLMHSQSALTEHMSLNLARFFAQPCITQLEWSLCRQATDDGSHHENYKEWPQVKRFGAARQMRNLGIQIGQCYLEVSWV